jgi:hypothetical protein
VPRKSAEKKCREKVPINPTADKPGAHSAAMKGVIDTVVAVVTAPYCQY